ncbi:mandelate racemase/muconate lactonizing enzyme family protein [Actinomadura macrotermitis]|uniref:D-galactarolactone cycloisomerase n=1 Tax=Actinomadura macrotermitis TaxID=2585200 RepID=A0A7K0BNE6_9ACTN|nr:mandelate racemase/muconate lactonizing enzyme family protein [Actinomadura macrotermitis]MQY02683.1 D-galactarolactone cycloisomerase [Actinomadura macrotermitis]
MTAALPIEDLRVRVFEVPLDEPVPMSFASLRARRTCVVEIRAGGLVGIGESWVNHPSWAWRERVATLREGVAPLLAGQDAADVRAVHGRLVRELLPLGRQWGAPGPIWQAISGVDMALWDLAAKAAGVPLAVLLGAPGPPAPVPVYASGIGPDRVEDLTERALALGARALKVKIGFGRERDEAVLRAARATAGDAAQVFADANQAWTPGEAVEMCALLADHGVAWCEEPVAGNALRDLEEVHRRTGMPLATGENVYTEEAFAGYLASPAVAHIQPDVAKTGGVTTALAVAARTAEHGTAFTPHCYTGAPTVAATAHVAAAAGAAWVEFDVRDNRLRTDLTTVPFQVRDGALAVPDGPGLGIELDEERIAPYALPV